MPPPLEKTLCLHFRTLLAPLPVGASIVNSNEGSYSMALGALERFVPATLAELYPEWKYESFDGFYPATLTKPAEREIDLFGLCILISDQTTTPLHVRFQLHPVDDELSWLEFRVGEKSPAGMMRSKGGQPETINKRLHGLANRANAIPWAYQVTFGERDTRPSNQKSHFPM